MTLFVLVVISVTALSMAAVSWKERTASMGESKSSIAFQNAQTGAETVLNNIKLISSGDASSFSGCQGDGTILSSGTYRVTLMDSDGDTVSCGSVGDLSDVVKLKSVGMATGVQRAIEASAKSRYKIGGTIAGLSGTIVLQNNGGDDLNISSNGDFSFSTLLFGGEDYAVTILTQPSEALCTISNGTGTVSIEDITDIVVSCSSTCPPPSCSTGPGCRDSLTNGTTTAGTCCGGKSCYTCSPGYTWNGSSCVASCSPTPYVCGADGNLHNPCTGAVTVVCSSCGCSGSSCKSSNLFLVGPSGCITSWLAGCGGPVNGLGCTPGSTFTCGSGLPNYNTGVGSCSYDPYQNTQMVYSCQCLAY